MPDPATPELEFPAIQFLLQSIPATDAAEPAADAEPLLDSSYYKNISGL